MVELLELAGLPELRVLEAAVMVFARVGAGLAPIAFLRAVSATLATGRK